jgi:hypothetical protein
VKKTRFTAEVFRCLKCHHLPHAKSCREVVRRRMEGKLVCRLNLWRKWQSIYLGFSGVLAGMLAGHETVGGFTLVLEQRRISGTLRGLFVLWNNISHKAFRGLKARFVIQYRRLGVLLTTLKYLTAARLRCSCIGGFCGKAFDATTASKSATC